MTLRSTLNAHAEETSKKSVEGASKLAFKGLAAQPRGLPNINSSPGVLKIRIPILGQLSVDGFVRAWLIVEGHSNYADCHRIGVARQWY